MKITVFSLFPEILEGFFQSSIMNKAVQKGLVEYKTFNIRDFTVDKHKNCDDSPYGGGAGMVLKCEPLAAALDSVGAKEKRVIFATPSGKLFKQSMAKELSLEEELIFICGRYEGIDQRIIDEYVDDEISIGDYVLSSGEISTLVIIDGIYRLIEGVISGESLEEESFSQENLLEYPHYTRPEVFRGVAVPEILLSGHHKKITEWRMEKRIEKTRRFRPDLLQGQK
ncbi:MAG: tRNA (guanosine(37)-N1)-methyltransferase TrmD [Spirochaetes bacterium GWB1_48_6]|nr:MAG: tRNA (guanosine(37)-N1)-methyltransferase TrmD [Spirochaetes bacterium GWB1_48_6]